MTAPIVMVGDMPDPVGGVAEWCLQVCARLQQRGVDVHFLDTERNPSKRPPPGLASYAVVDAREALAVRSLISVRGLRRAAAHGRPLLGPYGAKQALYTLLLAERIAAKAIAVGARSIVAHHASYRGMAGLLASRRVGARCTIVVHGAEFSRPSWTRARPAAVEVVQRADRVVTPSEHSRRLCHQFAGDREIDVLLNGVDHERFHTGVAPLDRWPGEQVVLFVGHVHERKGPDVLARAMPLLRSAAPVRAVFAGPDFGLEDEVRAIVGSSGHAASTTFLGVVPDADLAPLYRRADVFVFPTVWPTEGFGLVAAEAMACGTPVVASRIGAIPEVVDDGHTGLLVEAGDAAALAGALTELLGDEPRRQAMAAAAAEHARRFDWSTIADSLAADILQRQEP